MVGWSWEGLSSLKSRIMLGPPVAILPIRCNLVAGSHGDSYLRGLIRVSSECDLKHERHKHRKAFCEQVRVLYHACWFYMSAMFYVAGDT